MEIDHVTGAIVDAAYKIHVGLGPGLLESVYEAVLAKSLERGGFKVERQKTIRFDYDGMQFDEGFRVDLLVENSVIVELKSVEQLAPVHGKQVLTYLRLMDLRVGLLINFGAPTLKEGLKRIVNNLPPSASPRELMTLGSARCKQMWLSSTMHLPVALGMVLGRKASGSDAIVLE